MVRRELSAAAGVLATVNPKQAIRLTDDETSRRRVGRHGGYRGVPRAGADPQGRVHADERAGGVMTQLVADDDACGERAPGFGRRCLGCGLEFTPRRPTELRCTPRCRARLFLHAKRDEALRLVLAAIIRGDVEDARVRLTEVLGG